MQSQIALSQTLMAQSIAMASSRETCPISKELGMYLEQLLGHKLHLGLCNRLCTDTIPTASSKGVDLLPWGDIESMAQCCEGPDVY